MLLNIDDNRIALTIPPLWRLAFRPLFLGGSIFSILAIAWWSYYWVNPSIAWQPYGGIVWWHAHEMLYGFVIAIVTGFLLTAEQTWTGVIGIRGKPLILLFSLWLFGRISINLGGYVSPMLIAIIDCLYLPATTIAIAIPIIKVKQWRNFIFVIILFALSCSNIASHWPTFFAEDGKQLQNLSLNTIHGSILAITLIMVVLGGRVIPFFTANGTKTEKPPANMWLEVLSIGSLVVITGLTFLGYVKAPSTLMVLLCLFAALCNSLRFARWGLNKCWKIPLLWSLHLSYAFIPLGLFALACHPFTSLITLSTALHCFTAGAMGGLILSMMSRVSLGHTGRPLNPPPFMSIAFALIIIGGIIRIIIPSLFPVLTIKVILITAILWILSYGLYCWHYAPMLCQTRADGRPG